VAPRRDTSHGSRREDHAVAEYLAARSVERAVANDPVTAAQRFVAPARAVSEMPALTTEATDRLLDYAAWKEATGATEYDPRWEVRERTVEAPLPRDLLEHPREVIDAETRSAAASEARANAEVKLAANEVLKLVLTTATKPYLEHMSTFVEHFLEHHAVALDEMVMKYGEKVADGHIEKVTEPLLERATTLVSQRLDADAAPARDFVELRTADAARMTRRYARAGA
jgi:hypothetical protein